MLWFTRAALAFTLPLSAFVLFPRDARAQAPTRSGYTEQRTEAGAAVVFDDDLAKGTTFDPVGRQNSVPGYQAKRAAIAQSDCALDPDGSLAAHRLV